MAKDVTNWALLGALGYKGYHRGGGIEDPITVTIPVGSILMRLYRPQEPFDDHPSDYGNWWFTPHEYRCVCRYLGTDGRPLIADRSDGKSALHSIFGILETWASPENSHWVNPRQLSLLNLVRVTAEIEAYYGHAAPANGDGYSRTMKPMRVMGNKYARQLYIHDCHKRKSDLPQIHDKPLYTDATIGSELGIPSEAATAKVLYFEI